MEVPFSNHHVPNLGALCRTGAKVFQKQSLEQGLMGEAFRADQTVDAATGAFGTTFEHELGQESGVQASVEHVLAADQAVMGLEEVVEALAGGHVWHGGQYTGMKPMQVMIQ